MDKKIKKKEAEIINRLRSEILSQNKSYTSIGTKLDMSPNSVKRTVLGLNSPKLTNLIKICIGLGLEIEIKKK